MASQQPFSQRQHLHSMWILGLTALIFILDLFTPLGVATGALYIFIILATLFIGQRKFTLFLGGLTTVLIIIGLFLSPGGDANGHAILNRIIQMAAIGATVPLALTQISNINRIMTSEERLDLALQGTDEGIWDWPDTKLDQEWWSPQFYALLGYTPEEVSPSFSQFKALLHPEDHQPTTKALEDHFRHLVPFDVEYRLRTRSGEYRWFRGRGRSAQRHPKGPIRMVGSIDDITQRKNAQEKVRLIIEAAPSGMLMIDAHGKIVLANQLLARQFGYPHDALLGQTVERLVPLRYQDSHSAQRTAFFASPTSRQMGRGRDLFGLRRDGSEFPVEIGLNPVTTEEGTFVLASIIDITQRKKAEEFLADQNRLLALNAEVGRIINQTRELQPRLQQCTHAIVDSLHVAFAGIWTLNQNKPLLELEGSAGPSAHVNDLQRHIPLGQFTIGKIAAEKIPHVTNTVIGDPRVLEQDWATREGLVAFAGYPLIKGQNVVGVIAVFGKYPLTNSTLDTLKMVGDRITAAIERHFVRQALQELSRRNERILASAGEGIYGLDNEGLTTFINPAGARMLGYEAEELLGIPIHAAIHHTRSDGSPCPSEGCPMTAPLKDGDLHQVEDDLLWRKDGNSFPAFFTSSPIRDHADNSIGAVVVFSDITDRKHQERHLKELSNRLTLATQAAELGIWEWNIQENTLTWDSQMYVLYGLEPKSKVVSYESWANALHPQDRPSAEEAVQRAIQGKQKLDTEFRVLWPDGSVHWIRTIGSVEHDSAGMAIRMIGINWDITETKASQKAILQHTKDLEVSNQELDDFAYITSHDLKEPLRGIANYSRFLLEDHGPLLPEEGKEQCHTIIRLTQRMESLIESLRYYSRVGRTELAILPVNFDALLDDILLTLKPRLEETQVTIKRSSPLPTWPCDGVKIREVLANLITNAMKYNDKPEKWIQLSAQILPDSGHLEIAVRDNGIGIPQAHQQNIFRIFRRLHSRDKFGGGDGAGLTIVKKIMERHGGTIRLESTMGEGTTFFVALPPSHTGKGQDS
ncbi:MAG: PAS domain S-box protein [Nitrospira sp.]|nr:PAS domain S-box protein [Nitrospira sp.]